MKHGKNKTLYLWDLANTLFPESWNKKLAGFDTFDDYCLARGVDLNNPRQYEAAYQEPYSNGQMINLRIADGFKEVLSWTRYNETFTTGVKEQMDWRAKYLNPKIGFDVKSFFQKIVSTFDYGETNIKTREMLKDYLVKRYQQEYKTIVYTDDKLKNCKAFQKAAKEIKQQYPDFSCRLYNILNNNSGINKRDWYWEIGNLYDLLENEKRLAVKRG